MRVNASFRCGCHMPAIPHAPMSSRTTLLEAFANGGLFPPLEGGRQTKVDFTSPTALGRRERLHDHHLLWAYVPQRTVSVAL